MLSWVMFWIACSVVFVVLGVVRWDDATESAIYICAGFALAIAAALAMMLK